jgi:hypothetical protein
MKMSEVSGTVENAAEDILLSAVSQMKQRSALRDAPMERSMKRAVSIFNAWTGGDMSIESGWRFMIALKQAREIQGQFHLDDYVDGAAYFSLLGEEEGQTKRGVDEGKENGQKDVRSTT